MASSHSSSIALLTHTVDANRDPFDNRDDDAASVAGRPYHRLANEIVKLICGGELSDGDRLPSERILAQRFQCSRTSIREAIIALEIRGVVEVRGGSGIYVRGLKPSSFLTESSTGPFELLRGRLVIEPEICVAAASAAKDADLDTIYASILKMKDTVGDKRANEVADRAFHVAVASATGNGMLAQIVEGIWDRRRGEMWEKIEEHFHTPALREAAIEDHQRIFDALLSRDAADSKEQMRKHIERVIREFARAW